jgi:hypothetical protein
MKFNTKTIHGGQHDPTTGRLCQQFFKLHLHKPARETYW